MYNTMKAVVVEEQIETDEQLAGIINQFPTDTERESIFALIDEEDSHACYGIMSDAELFADVIYETTSTEIADEATMEATLPLPITKAQVMSSLCIIRTYLEENNGGDIFHHYFNLENAVVRKSILNSRQMTLDTFINYK